MFKYELHSHTSDGDPYAKLSGQDIVRAYYDAGYSGIVIANHYFIYFFDWYKDELKGLNHNGIIDRYLRGYYAAKNEGEKLGFAVLCGAEVRLGKTANDYLLYGLDEKDFYDLPLLCHQKSIQDLKSILPDTCLIVQAHPFRNGMTVVDPMPLFGIEVFNKGTEPYRNELAFNFAKHYGKAMTSGSDCHGPGAVGAGEIETDTKILSSRDLYETLTCGNYSLLRS